MLVYNQLQKYLITVTAKGLVYVRPTFQQVYPFKVRRALLHADTFVKLPLQLICGCKLLHQEQDKARQARSQPTPEPHEACINECLCQISCCCPYKLLDCLFCFWKITKSCCDKKLPLAEICWTESKTISHNDEMDFFF